MWFGTKDVDASDTPIHGAAALGAWNLYGFRIVKPVQVTALAGVLAPVVAAVVLPAVAAALSSKPTEEPQVVGHYSVSTAPAAPGNGLPTPVEAVSTEEGSTDDSVEALLLEAERTAT
jgi:hypothetical protein